MEQSRRGEAATERRRGERAGAELRPPHVAANSAGVWYSKALWGRWCLESNHQLVLSTRAWAKLSNSSAFRNLSRRRLWKRLQQLADERDLLLQAGGQLLIHINAKFLGLRERIPPSFAHAGLGLLPLSLAGRRFQDRRLCPNHRRRLSRIRLLQSGRRDSLGLPPTACSIINRDNSRPTSSDSASI